MAAATDRSHPGLEALLEDLARPEAYPTPTTRVEVVQTHISCVFLTDDEVYKLKKPLDLGFLDYSTPERRRTCCEAEVRLNRRLAPEVYLGVEEVRLGVDGRLTLHGGVGEPVAHAVRMRRLPDVATLERRLAAGCVGAPDLARLAGRIARFHGEARRGPELARWASFEAVRGNAEENFTQLEPFAGGAVPAELLAAVAERTRAELDRRRAAIEERATGAVDGHGDLRLEHVYQLGRAGAADEFTVVDCIEFNERLRCLDPVADAAFLVMEHRLAGRDDLARAFAGAYLEAAEDDGGAALLPLYTAYRATVRAKVHCFTQAEEEVGADERARAGERARAELLLALRALAPSEGPALLLTAGLPAAGKSTLAAALADRSGAVWIRSDAVRKELAGLEPDAPAGAELEGGIYAPAWTERTYAACLERAEGALLRGRRVVVDASFGRAARRRPFLDLARRLAVPARVLVCRAEPETAEARLASRRGGPSDADPGVYAALAARWEEPGADEPVLDVDAGAGRTPEETAAAAVAALRADGLA